MKDRTKQTIKNSFGSLISNATAINGAKSGPLWLTIVFFLLAVLLPVIPVTVAQSKTYGASFVSNVSYGFENYVTSIGLDLLDRGTEFHINNEHLLSVTETLDDSQVTINFDDYGSDHPYAAYQNSVTNEYEFILFLSNAKTSADKNLFTKNVANIKYKTGTTNLITESDVDATYYLPSYLVLFPNGIYSLLYGSNSNAAKAASYLGTFDKVEATDNLFTELMTVKDTNGAELDKTLANPLYVDGVLQNYKTLFNKSYANLKVKNIWMSSLIYLGIFFGLSLFMALLIFLLTRGKNNPNNYYSLWLCIKVEGWASLCPGLIGMLLGFLISGQGPLFFIMTLGMRIMWLTMKELRPNY